MYVRHAPAGNGLRRAGDYIRAALRIFGSQRLMSGGDWPICLLHEPY